MTDVRTFAELERASGQDYSPSTGDKWPLQEWYDSIRQTPVSQLSAGDLAKACRQDVWIEQVVPAAVEMLNENPEAGDLYDGELVVALKSVPVAYWAEHPVVADTFRRIIEQHLPDFDEDVQNDARELLIRLR
jgi:hypothetical protein